MSRAIWVATDHSRVCGEQKAALEDGGVQEGSPPRVRGTAQDVGNATHVAGITPACAGNSHTTIGPYLQCQDHPRVCGEQQVKIPSGGQLSGSPPRVRGTGAATPLAALLFRITPACAGNSCDFEDACPSAQDHPRVCGEQP